MSGHAKRFLLVITSIIAGYISMAQTTDRVKYYIAFDQSGSVAINDKFKHFNQQELFKHFVEITDQQKKSEIEFNLYPFGEDTVQRNVLTNSSSKVLSYAEVIDKTKHVTLNKFTHIDAAVNKILLDIQNEKDRPSSGVFIFTDGRLEDGDFKKKKDIQTKEQYIQMVNDSITKIKTNYNVPVYIILVSHENRQPYYNAISVFWHNNSLKVNEQDVSNLYNFVSEANLEISSALITPAVEKKAESKVTSEETLTRTAVYIHEAEILIGNDSQNPNASKISLKGLPAEGIEKILNEMNAILQKAEFSKKDIDDIYTYLNKLTEDRSFQVLIEAQSKQKALASDFSRKPKENAPLAKAAETETYSLEEKVILGFTDYVINRAKQEAVISFVEFIDCYDFGDDAVLIKERLFSNFFSLLKYDNSIYDVVMIRNALLKDIQELPRNLTLTRRFSSNGIVALYAFTTLYENILFYGSVEKSFDQLYKVLLTDKVAADMHNNQTFVLIKFTAKLIGCLERYNFDKVYLDDPEKLTKLSKMLIAMALHDAIGEQSIDVSNAEEMIVNVYRQYQTIKKQIEQLNKDLQINENGGNLKELREYQQEIVQDIIKKSAELLFAGAIILERTIKIDAENYIRDAKQGVEIWFAVREQRYSDAAFLAAPSILKIVSQTDNAKMLNTLQTLVFVAGEASDAKNPDDIQKIIAKHTLPVASYKVKRKYFSSFMLTAYPGFGGTAYLKRESTDYALSITAPVGIEFTLGRYSFMFPLFDFGNVIDYRFNNNKDNKDVVSFERIVSPGFVVSYGLSNKFPVSVNAGYQFNPERLTIALALDLPLIGFWKNTEKRKIRNKSK
ncbi:MAG: vWA domain-containing protein [bacterium]